MTGRRSHGRLSALNGVVHQGTATPQHAGEWSLQGVTGVSSFFWRAASRIARLSSRVASGTSDRSSIRSETSATRCIGGTCTLSARAARRKFGPSFAVRKSCARVVSRDAVGRGDASRRVNSTAGPGSGLKVGL